MLHRFIHSLCGLTAASATILAQQAPKPVVQAAASQVVVQPVAVQSSSTVVAVSDVVTTTTVCLQNLSPAVMTDVAPAGVLASLRPNLTPNVGHLHYSASNSELIVTDRPAVVESIVRQVRALDGQAVPCLVEVSVVQVVDAGVVAILAKDRSVRTVAATQAKATQTALVEQGAEVVTLPRLVANTGQAATMYVGTSEPTGDPAKEEEAESGMAFQLETTMDAANGAFFVSFQMNASELLGDATFGRYLTVPAGQTAVFGEQSGDGQAMVMFVTVSELPVAAPGK